jgi:hypothetical protein
MPHTARNDNDDGEANDDWSGQEEDEGDDEFESDFADWHDDPKVLVSAWSTAVSTAKTLTHPAWRRLQNLVGRASSGSVRRLWKQPPLTFSAVQRDRVFPPPEEDVTRKERRKTHPQAYGTRSIRTSFGLVKVYNKAAIPRAPVEEVTYPRAHGTRSIRTSFGAVEVYNRVASPTPLMEEVTYPRAYGTRSIQTPFGIVKVYNRAPIPTPVFSDGHLQRQMTRTS